MLISALEFLGLEPGFTSEELKRRFYLLSKKYHPDTGEFSNDSLFKKLIEFRDVLENHLAETIFQKKNLVSEPQNETTIPNEDYGFYKQGREIYDAALHEYFKFTEGNPIFLKGEENPALRKLRSSLEISKNRFEELIRSFPKSIWVGDAKDTLQKIAVWFKEP
ncbi:molecular chaperone DnaJ [Leptospira gomenensis]|uniref:Molecular chaperone DnaJ n=1 Tax=Leptospira gomenensis TaxID=2484974 RepID=A0A5F1YFL8_9LEPT|nr:J domain-containing protein [Leptospira gomenensis]TGK38684.1 molecular chaperone DnaJ [Leptospira gomenensis]TGK42911.1 molecular chaperone DnaJ [Leptospira gomenensis]TGK49630.1 molecular chaperone DnaJ [Leptospira gomenensis]TGK60808.1 molecular chaperone DnaJ [Leptospira gomenensis]